MSTATGDTTVLVDLSAHIVTAYVARNAVSPADLPTLIVEVHAALAALGASAEPEEAQLTPAVSIRRSLQPNAITCLECGQSFQTLRRHLSAQHGLTPQAYRLRWNLPPSYPMVAPNYSEVRSRTAKASGLGRKPAKKAARKRSR